MRGLAAACAALVLQAGCSNPNKKERKPVDHNDASHTHDGSTAAATPARPATVPQIVTLFREAVGCAPSCPQADQLRAAMRDQPNDAAAAALEIMADPDARTDAGVGQEALFFLRDWLDTATGPEVQRLTSKALERVIAEGQPLMRGTAYSFLGEHRLPDAERILIAEAENPARDPGDRAAAGTALGAALTDFALIRRWLTDDRPFHWLAGLHAMDTFAPDSRASREADERALVVALGKRPELPGDVVYALASYYEAYLRGDPNDAEVRGLAERWSRHADVMAAGQMRKILVGNPAPPHR